MSHVNKVFDSDPHFTISPITRQIVNDSSKKTTLIQYDHNSERFSFELDRIVEGHDMTECNLVEVQFINTGANSSEVTKDVYEVKDLQIKPDDDTKIVFTWLLSNNATMYEGKLAFAIRFACINADGSVDYAWHTATHENIKISKGMNNADDVVTKEMSDILAQWKAELFGTSEEGVENIYTARDASLEAIATAEADAVDNINATKDENIEAISTAKADALQSVQSEGTTQLEAIETAKNEAVTAIENAVGEVLEGDY